MSDHDIQVTLGISFNFTAARSEVEGRTPFEVAALLQSRLGPEGFFIWGAKVEVESADGHDFREARFNDIEYEFLIGVFTGDEAIADEYLADVPPGERAAWAVTEETDPIDLSAREERPVEETTAANYNITSPEEREQLQLGIVEAVESILEEVNPGQEALLRAFNRLMAIHINKIKNGDIVGSEAAEWSMAAIHELLERSHSEVAIDGDGIIRTDFRGEAER